jgi:hypothetical protein
MTHPLFTPYVAHDWANLMQFDIQLGLDATPTPSHWLVYNAPSCLPKTGDRLKFTKDFLLDNCWKWRRKPTPNFFNFSRIVSTRNEENGGTSMLHQAGALIFFRSITKHYVKIKFNFNKCTRNIERKLKISRTTSGKILLQSIKCPL